MNVAVFVVGLFSTAVFVCIVLAMALDAFRPPYGETFDWFLAGALAITGMLFGLYLTLRLSGAYAGPDSANAPTPVYIIVTATPEADRR